MTELDFHLQADEFLNKLFNELNAAKIEIEKHWDIDHLCYRSDTEENYSLLKKSFSTFSELLIESMVGGRLISTYKLNRPIKFNDYRIDIVELPAPKKGKTVALGFEHIEVVCDIPFSELKEKYSHLNLDLGGLKKNFNREFEIILGPRNLKFHHSSLASVINIEKNIRVWSAVNKSDILNLFFENNPLIAGTFPLDIYTETSDLDIILEAFDFNILSASLVKHFGSSQEFKITSLEVDHQPTLICNFIFDGIPFEVFAQNRPSVQQTAYLHLLIEERLLKIGGDSFKQKVKNARLSGVKTEPAFAEILMINTDPFKSLLDFQTKSFKELERMFT
jgi:predicted metalloenzyme YecM